MRALLSAVMVVIASLPLAVRAQPQPQPQPQDGEAARREREARALHEKGLVHYNLGEYAEAAQAFRSAYELSQAPGLLFNLGQAHRLRAQPGSCAEAARAYRAYLRLDPEGRNRAIAEKYLPALDECARREPSAAEGGAESGTAGPTGSPAVTPPPLPSTALTPPPAGGARRTLGWVAVGVGGAALVGGAVTGILAVQKWKDLEGPCGAGCPPALHDDNDTYDSLRTWTTVGLAAGAVIGATGGVLLWTAPGERREQVAVATDGQLLIVRGEF